MPNDTEPRAFTLEECRDQFLEHVRESVQVWNESNGIDTLAKLNGLAFSILAILDGAAIDIPGFLVTPNPHPTDQEYKTKRGENYWPTDVDIAGQLHDHFAQE